MMKAHLTQSTAAYFFQLALEGNGRERYAGGGNRILEITVMRSDLENLAQTGKELLVNGTVSLTINNNEQLIGYTFRPFKPKQKEGQ